MNHEFWNEIGNLYFMCGAYEPAIHAYLRSIKLENSFGRSYSNLAMAYVQTGKYSEAIKLYRRGIELLSDKKEKAVTWNRLGILYRQVKEYNNALEAYQRADLIMPQEDTDKIEVKLPLTVSKPEIDLDAILAKGNLVNLELHSDLLEEINAEFEMAESDPEKSGSEEVMTPQEFENYSQIEGGGVEPSIGIQSEWKLAYMEENLPIEPPSVLIESETAPEGLEDLDIIPVDLQNETVVESTQIKPSSVLIESETESEGLEDLDIIPVDLQNETVVESTQIELSSVLIESETESEGLENLDIIPVDLQNESVVESTQIKLSPVSEVQPEPSNIFETVNVNGEDAMESITFYESNSHAESQETVISETDAEAAQYSQVDYPLTGISPEERQALDLEIIKYQQATSKNPRSYILWESLGEAYKSAGQYKDAIPAFQKAISMNPTNSMCHYRLGLVYAAEKREQEAIRAFKKVLELDPRSSQAHASLASQYRKMGLEEDAQEHIEKARAMQVEGESDYNHACLEAICGNNERALELLEVALQSKQTYVTWVQNDPDFHSLHNDHRFQMILSAHATSTC
jgi:tetratricopeptide (TPR) repeat protein